MATKNQNKTVETKASVSKFVASLKDETRRAEMRQVIALMKRATGDEPRMWGTSIVGFGSYKYKYPSGREGDWFTAGVSPRKTNLTFYILPGLHLHADNLKMLGKITTGKSCIYARRLDDVKLPILEKMVRQAVGHMKAHLKSSKESAV